MITEVVHTWHRTTDGALFDNKPAAERWEKELGVESFLREYGAKHACEQVDYVDLAGALVEAYPQLVEPAPKPLDFGEFQEECIRANLMAYEIFEKFNITRKEV